MDEATFGRVAESAVLTRAFEHACAAEGSVVVLVGEAGVGKTYLLSEFLATIEAAGSEIVDITPMSDTPTLPLAPVAASATGHAGTSAADELLSAVRGRVETREILRLFDEHVSHLASQAEGAVVVVLDSADAADPALVAAASHVARRSAARRVLTIFSMRPDETQLDTLLRATDALILPVEPFDSVTAEEFVRDLGGDLDDDDISEIVARAGGNPLFLQELAASSAGNGAATLGLLLLRRIDRLSPAAREALRVAAVCSEPVGGRFCALVGGRDPEDHGPLAEIADEGLAVVTDDGTIEFTNPVIADIAVTSTPRTEMCDLRRRIAGLLTLMGADAALIAPHALASASTADDFGGRAMPMSIDAATEALARGAPATALDLARRALALHPPPMEERDLITIEGEALLHLGRNTEATGAFERALALGAGESATLGLARALQRSGRLAAALDVFGRCKGAGAARGRAEVLLGLGRTGEAAEAAAVAVDEARAAGDSAQLAAALADRALADAVQNQERAIEVAGEAVALWRELGEDSLDWPPLFALGVALEANDQFARSLRALGELRGWLDVRGMLDLVPRVVRTETISAFLSCDWAHMDEALAAAIDAKRHGQNHEMGPIWASAAALAAARGDDHGWERSNTRSHEALAGQATPFDRALAAWWRCVGHIFRVEGREAIEAAEGAATGFRRIGALDFLARTLPLAAVGAAGGALSLPESVAMSYESLTTPDSRPSTRAGAGLIEGARAEDHDAAVARMIEAAHVFAGGEHHLGMILATSTAALMGGPIPDDLRDGTTRLVRSLQMRCALVEVLR